MRVQVRGAWFGLALLCAVALAAAVALVDRGRTSKPALRPVPLTRTERDRQALFAEIQPVKLANCDFDRFGESHDGGYLLCGNLLGDVASAYSYGISGYDQWGCDVSARLGVRVHQYDCFNLTHPVCPTGRTVFHAECIGSGRRVEDGRSFDTLENQIRKNGDTGKRLVVKMDVEGAEWESLLGASDVFLQRIDQMAIEFHGFDRGQYLLVLWKLKRFFYIANLHWNNFACDTGLAPFPSGAYEILLVNKRLGVPAAGQPAPSPLDWPNMPEWPDCQADAKGTVARPSRQGD